MTSIATNLRTCSLDMPIPVSRANLVVRAINDKLKMHRDTLEGAKELNTFRIEVKFNHTGGVRGTFVTYETGRVKK